jgi:hypothetical protein
MLRSTPSPRTCANLSAATAFWPPTGRWWCPSRSPSATCASTGSSHSWCVLARGLAPRGEIERERDPDQAGQVDRGRGTTLAFKYDPLETVVISSTFDKVASVRRFLQTTIERQLRAVFLEDLPRLVHALSRRRPDTDGRCATAWHLSLSLSLSPPSAIHTHAMGGRLGRARTHHTRRLPTRDARRLRPREMVGAVSPAAWMCGPRRPLRPLRRRPWQPAAPQDRHRATRPTCPWCCRPTACRARSPCSPVAHSPCTPTSTRPTTSSTVPSWTCARQSVAAHARPSAGPCCSCNRACTAHVYV